MAGTTSGRRAAWTLLATGLGLFMIFLDATIVNVALPDIQSDFHASESGLQWVVAAYSVTMAMFMMTGATFSDLRGRRRAYVFGLAIFCSASAACSLAPSLSFLAVARGIQGVGAGVVNVASLALVGAAFTDPKEKTRAIGTWTGVAAVGLAIGPMLGGILTEHIGWRSIFICNPIIGIVAVILTFRFVDESADPTPRGFDPPGQVLFIVGIGALTFALIQAPVDGWLSAEIAGSFVAAVVALGAFVWQELRSNDPMMDVRVFRDRVYSTALYTVFAILFVAYGTLFVITQYFQNVRTYSPEKTGFMMLAYALPSLILAPITGRLTAAHGGRGPALAGLGFATVASAILAASNASHLATTLLALAFMGTGAGFGIASTTSVAMVGIEPKRSGMASGILSSQRALGSTAGFAIMGSVLAATLSISLTNRLEPLIPDQATRDEVVAEVADEANPQAVTALIGPGEPLPDDVTEDDAILAETDDAFIAGIRVAMLVGFAVTSSALVLAWFTFPRHNPRPASQQAPDRPDGIGLEPPVHRGGRRARMRASHD
jgi:EmrB/QacA subfamily drug resistance transporter